MSYIGSTPTTQSFIAGTDYFNGDGSTVAFTLSRSVVSVNDIEAVINNVVQQPNTAYTVSGSTITFTSAPSSGTANIYVRYLSTTTQSITPSQGTVGNNQFANNISAIPMTYGTIGAGNSSTMKNRIINGAMQVAQYGGIAVANGSGATVGYSVDRWAFYGSVSSKFTGQQASATNLAGFNKYLLLTSSAATSVGASDNYEIYQRIEGLNTADLNWGTANAKTVTLSFWVQSTLTGTFGGSLGNGANNRSYPFTYSIPTANTWTQISITIAGDTSGTWATDNTTGISLYFGLGVGSTYSGTAGSWASGLYFSATGATNFVSTSGATLFITGVQLEVGSSATGFEYRQFTTELQLAQRYFTSNFAYGTAPSNSSADNRSNNVTMFSSSNAQSGPIYFPVRMRTTPSITPYAPNFTTPGGTWAVYPNNWGLAVGTVPTFGNSYETFCVAQFAGLSGYTNGNSYIASGYFTASAEL